jgi:hypothetical protein
MNVLYISATDMLPFPKMMFGNFLNAIDMSQGNDENGDLIKSLREMITTLWGDFPKESK